MLQDNLKDVQQRMEAAVKRAGRNPADITLIAVSKTKPVEMLAEVYEQGIREYGENYVQEIVEKYDKLPADIHWHMIGHLQRNKVKYIIDKVCMIHSVDSLRLAEQIQSEAAKRNLVMDILLEINIAEEDSKFGFTTESIREEFDTINSLPNVRIRGLMTSAPYTNEAESNRQYFKGMRELFVDLKNKSNDNNVMDILSMGMTGDFEVAIEEGATHIRVGTAIFGARDYSNKGV